MEFCKIGSIVLVLLVAFTTGDNVPAAVENVSTEVVGNTESPSPIVENPVVVEGNKTEEEISESGDRSGVLEKRSIGNIARLLLGGNVPPNHPLVKYSDPQPFALASSIVAAVPKERTSGWGSSSGSGGWNLNALQQITQLLGTKQKLVPHVGQVVSGVTGIAEVKGELLKQFRELSTHAIAQAAAEAAAKAVAGATAAQAITNHLTKAAAQSQDNRNNYGWGSTNQNNYLPPPQQNNYQSSYGQPPQQQQQQQPQYPVNQPLLPLGYNNNNNNNNNNGGRYNNNNNGGGYNSQQYQSSVPAQVYQPPPSSNNYASGVDQYSGPIASSSNQGYKANKAFASASDYNSNTPFNLPGSNSFSEVPSYGGRHFGSSAAGSSQQIQAGPSNFRSPGNSYDTPSYSQHSSQYSQPPAGDAYNSFQQQSFNRPSHEPFNNGLGGPATNEFPQPTRDQYPGAATNFVSQNGFSQQQQQGFRPGNPSGLSSYQQTRASESFGHNYNSPTPPQGNYNRYPNPPSGDFNNSPRGYGSQQQQYNQPLPPSSLPSGNFRNPGPPYSTAETNNYQISSPPPSNLPQSNNFNRNRDPYLNNNNRDTNYHNSNSYQQHNNNNNNYRNDEHRPVNSVEYYPQETRKGYNNVPLPPVGRPTIKSMLLTMTRTNTLNTNNSSNNIDTGAYTSTHYFDNDDVDIGKEKIKISDYTKANYDDEPRWTDWTQDSNKQWLNNNIYHKPSHPKTTISKRPYRSRPGGRIPTSHASTKMVKKFRHHHHRQSDGANEDSLEGGSEPKEVYSTLPEYVFQLDRPHRSTNLAQLVESLVATVAPDANNQDNQRLSKGDNDDMSNSSKNSKNTDSSDEPKVLPAITVFHTSFISE